jgi:hypothetical protein
MPHIRDPKPAGRVAIETAHQDTEMAWTSAIPRVLRSWGATDVDPFEFIRAKSALYMILLGYQAERSVKCHLNRRLGVAAEQDKHPLPRGVSSLAC